MKRASRAALAQDVSRLVRQALFNAAMSDSHLDDEPALTVERARVPQAPMQLAAAHPGGASERAAACAMYERCLEHYRACVRARQADAGVDDVGAAVSHFVAANMQALHGARITEPMLLRLERQLAGLVRTSAGWMGATAREQQQYFERMAILAVLISETSTHAMRQGPAAVANVRRAARGYLLDLLGLDPEQLALGVDGLSVRVPAAQGNAGPLPSFLDPLGGPAAKRQVRGR